MAKKYLASTVGYTGPHGVNSEESLYLRRTTDPRISAAALATPYLTYEDLEELELPGVRAARIWIPTDAEIRDAAIEEGLINELE